MNLHQIVSGAIGTVNPFVPLAIQISSGFTQAADYTQVPTYEPAFPEFGQVQALTYTDLMKLDALNIQGIRRAIYINGKLDSLVRVDRKGGDLITMSDGTIWLVAHVLEYWPDWVKVAVTLQNERANTP